MDPSQSSPSPNLISFLRENKTSEECNELLLTLPQSHDWVNISIYLHQGFWLNSFLIQGVVNAQTHFSALPTDVVLATNPKSGTTWLKAVLFTLLNRQTHPVSAPNHPLTAHGPHDLVPFLEVELYANKLLPDLSTIPSPRIFATHVPFQALPSSISSSKCKVVYLCRDPKDTFVSLWHFTNKMKPSQEEATPLEEAFEGFCHGAHNYGPFWDHVLSYWNAFLQRPSEVLFLKYEEFKRDPASCVRRLAGFLGCPFSSAEEESGVAEKVLGLCSFDHLSSLKVNLEGSHKLGITNESFFRRGEVGDWVNHLTPEMVERLERINEEKLRGSELKF